MTEQEAAQAAADSYSEFESFLQQVANHIGVPRFVVALCLCVIIILIAKIAVKLESVIFHRMANRSEAFSSLQANLVIRIVQVVIWIIAVVTMLACWKINLTPVLAGLGIVGMVVGFALQESINSLFCGVMIAVNRPFREGDWIAVGSEVSGFVLSMDVMCVTIMTLDNQKVTISNNKVWGNTIVNATYTDTRRFNETFAVGYESDIDLTREVVRDLIYSIPELLRDRDVTVEVFSYNENDISIIVRFWVKTEDYWPVYWRYHADLLPCLRAHGISMSYPHVVVHQGTETDNDLKEE